MPARYRTLRRTINCSHPLYMVAIALATAVLMLLEIASATMAKLLRPAHYHVGLHAGRADTGSGASTMSFDALVDDVRPNIAIKSAQPSAGTGYGDAHGRERGHSHSHCHAGAHSGPHGHDLLQRPGNGHADEPAHRHAPEPTAPLRSETVLHAHNHAAGVGHHRHASGTAGVVYVGDEGAPQLPAQTLTCSLDVTAILLPAHLRLLVRAAATFAPPEPPPAPLVAQYSLPAERPPSSAPHAVVHLPPYV